jgi:hypothetical protein
MRRAGTPAIASETRAAPTSLRFVFGGLLLVMFLAALDQTIVATALLARLTTTGEQRLSDLLQEWRPEEDEELARMIATVAREFFIDPSALGSPAYAASE